jgi:hypothetical protein
VFNVFGNKDWVQLLYLPYLKYVNNEHLVKTCSNCQATLEITEGVV